MISILDFIGNNYQRSTQIALALGTLGKTTYTERKYLADLVSTDFKSLNIPGVEIFFDDLSKIEIINYINKQNFNRTDYLKKDYENFKKYLQINSYPTHMDYIDSELAPDLIRFMKTKINNQKNKSYYTFLKKIGEEDLPYFTEQQIDIIDNISELLPIVRCDEMFILKKIVNDEILDLNMLIDPNNKVVLKI